MAIFRPTFFALAALLAAAPPRAAADEQLDYDITWVGVSVGNMVVRSGTNAVARWRQKRFARKHASWLTQSIGQKTASPRQSSPSRRLACSARPPSW